MKLVLAVVVMSLVACAANVGTSGGVKVPSDSGATCTAYCQDIGMQLSSVVIMANNVGCVCSPPGVPAATAATGSTSAGAGMAAIVVMQEAEQQQQQQTTPPPAQ